MYKGTYTHLRKDVLSNYEMSFDKKRFATSSMDTSGSSYMLYYNSVTLPEAVLRPISNSLLSSYGFKATKMFTGYKVTDESGATMGCMYTAKRGKMFRKYNFIQLYYNNVIYDIYTIKLHNEGEIYLIFNGGAQIAQVEQGRIGRKNPDAFNWYAKEKDYFDIVGLSMTYISCMKLKGRSFSNDKKAEKELVSLYNPFFTLGD